MAIHLHLAPSTDLLAAGLADVLSVPLDDPFAQEVVAVPAKGTERWLAQRLAHRLGVSPGREDGVCTGIRFLSPGSLVAMLLGVDRDDAWQPDRLAWPVLATIDGCLDEDWATPLAAHLGHRQTGLAAELRRNRRYSLARRLAGLFSSYAASRPALLTDWREGRNTDGAGAELPLDLHWQAELYRRLLARVDGPAPDLRLAATIERLVTGDQSLDLPGRLSLFGHTRIPAAEIEVIRALGVRRDVHLWLPQVSPALWERLAPEASLGPVRRATDPSRARHPLLSGLGRDARELQRSLAPLQAAELSIPAAPPPPGTLLTWLQADLRADVVPGAAEREARTVTTSDRSIQVHACHGPARQVEVLREVLAGLLADDPTLEPRDIVVMCPDVEAYAPLISAGFGLPDVLPEQSHPAHQLRVQLADRSRARTNPLLGLALTLVDLAGSRVTSSEVLDLLGSDPVRRRFGLDDDEIARCTQWVRDSAVRWGLDAASREPFGMGSFPHNTWRAGLDRLLIGVTMADDDHRALAHVLPLDDVPSDDIELVGLLTEYVDRLHTCLSSLAAAETVSDWTDALRDGVLGLGAPAPDDAWQQSQLEAELAQIATAATDGSDGSDGSDATDGDCTLTLGDVRALLRSRLASRPTRANFRTGALTVCTMVPMRSVPHRVVCLLGLDDETFPRAPGNDGDDVLARDPMTGERDPRSEDRQLLLDAVLAAGEHLVLCYSGADEHSGAHKPPSVPLGELLDACRLTASGPGLASLRIQHPLQGHHPANLSQGGLVPDRVFSFDRAALGGALAAYSHRSQRPQGPGAATPVLPSPLSPPPAADLALDDLIDFFKHPARAFLRDRAQLATPRSSEEVAEAIPISLTGLEQWEIGDRVLSSVLGGADPGAVLTAELLRGSLPPRALGHSALEQIVVQAQLLYQQTAHLRSGPRRVLELDLDLGEGRRLTGAVENVFGNRLITLGYSRLKAATRLQSWIRLLAVSAALPDESWTAHTIGRDKRHGPQHSQAGPLDHRALTWLRELIDLYDLGQTRPLPLPVAAAEAWVEGDRLEQRGTRNSGIESAAREWETDDFNAYGITGEDDDPWHTLAWGPRAPIETLIDDGLPELAKRVWTPLLDGAERVGPL